ncbi:MAG: nitrilase-related carbon-nitrogen hydrolase [Halobacteriota archaeon]
MTYTVACVQVGALGAWKENVERAVTLVEETNADLVVLPELFAQCRDFTKAEPIPGRTSDTFTRVAREQGIYLVMGSMLESDGDERIYNTSLLIDARGEIIARYRKIHLFSYGSKERRSLAPGSDVVVVDTPFGMIGMSICYDLRFPEVYRALVKKGAEIIVCPAAWPYPRLEHGLILNRPRAIEEQCYLVSCNQVGTPVPQLTFFGRSMITDPWGEVIVTGNEREGIINAPLDVDVVHSIRAEYRFLDDIVDFEVPRARATHKSRVARAGDALFHK